MKKLKALIAGLFLLLVLPLFSSALGIGTPNEINSVLPFSDFAGKTITINYLAGNVKSSDDVQPVSFVRYFCGDMIDYVKPEAKPVSFFKLRNCSEIATFQPSNYTARTLNPAELEGYSFDISLPNELSGGEKQLHFGFLEVPSNPRFGTGVGARLAIEGVLKIRVPYPGKFLEIVGVRVNNTIKGEPLRFAVDAASRGNQTIDDARLQIEVIDPDNKTVALVNTPTVVIPNQTTHTFEQTIDSNLLEVGNYRAVTTVFYAGSKSSTETVGFKIGKETVNIVFVNITDINPAFPFTKRFKIDVESFWNQPINGITATVQILDADRNFLFSTTSPGYIALAPFSQGSLFAVVDLPNKTANYVARIVLTFPTTGGGVGNSIKEVQFAVVAPGQGLFGAELPAGAIGILIGLLFGLIVLAIAWFLSTRSGAKIIATITTTNDKPIYNATVAITKPGFSASQKTDQNGVAEFKKVPSGVITINATAAGYDSSSKTTSLQANTTLVVDLSLTEITAPKTEEKKQPTNAPPGGLPPWVERQEKKNT
ncbi:MAG TPA: carboxypeptidase-like regulatory domain-containing protein [Candidatus Norongarragalinales archaeon]|nr:carboxypeptidase-like regulatory domain-containing protein [Candidatus Norongarragalinales archaeon]